MIYTKNGLLRGICVVTAGLALVFPAHFCRAQTCTPAPSGIVSWWSAEGDASDSVGGNNGSLGGAVTFGPGEAGQAFVFDGNNSYVDVGNPASLQLQNFTIEAWIKRSSSSAISLNAPNAQLFGYGDNGYGLGMWSDGRVYLTKNNVDQVAVNAGLTDTNNFHHVAVTKGGSNVTFFVDGVALPSATYGQAFTFDGSASIGAYGSTQSIPFFGLIDELAVYNRPLSTNEIQNIYQARAGGKCLNGSPTITSQPTNQTVFVGRKAAFSVAASGALPLLYQWSVNGTNIQNATNYSLTLTNLQFAQSGAYQVTVTNGSGSAVSTAATLTVNPLPPCTSAPSNLVSWWSAEGNAVDNTGGNNGALGGNTSYGTGEVGNQSFVFEGSNSFINVGNPANLQLQDFTIEAWIQRFSSSIVSKSSSTAQIFGYGNNGYALGLWSDGRIYLTKNNVGQVAVSAGLVDTNSFHHVAVTKVGTNVTFYVDGVALPSVTYSVVFSFTTSISIGAYGSTQSSPFFGAIDELAVYSRALIASEIQSIYNSGAGGKCALTLPPSIYLQPTNQTVPAGGQATLTVGAAGSPTLCFQWNYNGVPLAGATQTSLALTNVQPAQSNVYTVLVSNSLGSVLSSKAILTINPVLQLVNATASGGTVLVPVTLLASGNENALQFSVNYSTSLLTFAGVSLGSNAASGFISVNTNQLANGRVGIDVLLPFDTAFPSGIQQVAQINFKTAPLTTTTTTPLNFGDLPTVRQVSDPDANTIPATYSNATVTIPFLGYEGDLAPRTNGDASLTLADWIQEGRFVAGLDNPTNSGEFLRADTAPRATLGNGLLTVADWVQVWRYATGTDALVQGGGPAQSVTNGTPSPSATRVLSISNSTVQAGQTCQISVQLNAQGNETAVGFSLSFDPALLTLVSVQAGGGISNATFIANTNQAAAGKIGIALEMPSLSVLSSGTQEVAKLTFAVSPYATHGATLAFTNQPVLEDVADINASSLPVGFQNGVLSINNSILKLGTTYHNNSFVLSWPASLTGFRLESSTNLARTNWVIVTSGMVTNNGTVTLTNSTASTPRMFYRLHHP